MQKVTYLEISYPNFVLGAIIDPEEANQNNYEFVTKINDVIISSNVNIDNIIKLDNVKADKTLLTSTVSELAGLGRTDETVKQNSVNLTNHKSSVDHDSRYYTKTILNNGELNKLYYTKTELAPWLSKGDTSIQEEVYTIVNANNGDGTFSYQNANGMFIGELTEDGYQVFHLQSGVYQPGTNRLEIIINDTLRRSVASGGVEEIDNVSVALTSPESSGAEITIKYYERVGLSAEYTILISKNKPPLNMGKNLWFELIG